MKTVAARKRARILGPRMCAALTVVIAGLALAACGSSSSSSSSSSTSSGSKSGQTTSLSLVLAWYPTAGYGGVYAAEKEGYFAKQGLAVTVKPGGPSVSPTQVVGSGQAEVGYLNSDMTLMQAWQDGIELTEFATTNEIYPEGVEYHKSNPIHSLSEANGKTMSTVTGSLDYEWLQHTYKLKNKIVPFSYATFAHDNKSLLLGYAVEDIPALKAEGVDAGYIPVSESGLKPYADILFAKSSWVEAHNETAKKFLQALAEGWSYYRNHFHEINELIHEKESTTPVSTLDAIAEMQDESIYGGGAATNGIGTIEASRVQDTYNKLKALGVLKKELDISKVANTELQPKVLPPTKESK